MTEVRVPTLGESVTEATVATWFKKPGDSVAQDEMLCELETDKVTVEVPAPMAGTLSEIVAAEGDTVGVDALLAQISEGGAAPVKTDDAPKAEPAAASTAADMDIMVPTLGESVTEATVSTWFKKPGEAFAADEMLCELETDKVSVEVPAPAAGVMTKLLAEEGATVEAGGKLAIMSTDAASAAAQPATESPKARRCGQRQRRPRHERRRAQGDGSASPSTRRRPARARGRRSGRPRRTGQDDPPAPNHRAPPQRQPEYRRHADHI